MNYRDHYERLICRARARSNLSGYVEIHHVLPRCLGGTDDAENLVALTPEEHLVAHLLLVKLNPEHSGLSHAANMMISRFGNNKWYGWLKRKSSGHIRDTLRAHWDDPAYRDRQRMSHTGKALSAEQKQKISVAVAGDRHPMHGKKHTLESIAKMRDAKLGLTGDKNYFFGKKHTPETSAKMKAAWARRKAASTEGACG